MDKDTYEALQKSIAHWEANATAMTLAYASTDTSDCALCERFLDSSCLGCPIFEATGKGFCQGTPYYDADRARHYLRNLDAFHIAAEEELNFLRSLVPAGGPK